MRLERVMVRLRPRDGWEALDLGFRMAATWWAPIWGVWLAVFLPMAIVLHLALPGQPFFAAVLTWWCKPIPDRFVLHVVSRHVFGERPTLAGTLAAWRELLHPGLLAQLTWRRLDPARAFHLPVAQLEGQGGRAASARRALLSRRFGGAAFALTAACAGFVLVTATGLAVLVGVLLHAGGDPFAAQGATLPGAEPAWWALDDSAYYVLAETLVEPFHVAGGFSLYLSRRVMLEAWDVELALRRLGARAPPLARAAVLALVLLGAGLAPSEAQAAPGPGCKLSAPSAADADVEACEPSSESASPTYSTVARDSATRRVIEQVLADPAFGAERQVLQWRSRAAPAKDSPPGDLRWMQRLAALLSEVLRVLGWLAVLATVLALIWLVARQIGGRDPAAQPRAGPPAELFGLAIAPDSLPGDIPAAARALLAAGEVRAALSLIYRGALSYLVHVRGLRVAAGATEHEVGAGVQGVLAAPAARYFARLLAAWILTAYGRREPDEAALLALCDEYAQHFVARPAGVLPG